MINLILFFLSFTANLVIIKTIPIEIFKSYINLYTIVGCLGSLAFFILYTKYLSIDKVKKTGYLLIFLYCFLYNVYDLFWASIIIYPLLLLFNDYIFTQCNLKKTNLIYRTFLIISALPFILYSENFRYLFESRVLIMAIILLAINYRITEASELNVKSTWQFIFFNYTFYYAPLLIIGFIMPSTNGMKYWYVFTQTGLVIYLKYLDYCTRKNRVAYRSVENLILVCACGSPVLPYYFFPNNIAIFTFYAGLLGLIYSKKFLIDSKEIK